MTPAFLLLQPSRTTLSLPGTQTGWPQSFSNRRNPVLKHRLAITNQSGTHVNFSSSLSTDLPLNESLQVPFEQYMLDRQRIFQALFPDKRRCERLNDEEWRIYMLPLNFLFLSINPVVDMRVTVRLPEESLPFYINKEVKRVLTLEATRWELQGLDYILKPSDFVLGINGALYSERKGLASRLRGQLRMSVSFVPPPSLKLIPEEASKGIGEALLIGLLQSMKEKVNNRLLKDYKDYAKELSKRTNESSTPKTASPAI